ncbi:lipoate--protein ligase family protein [Halopiger xanaduensis]|uniref:Biotin/lipoate A/B protein ligase n=1 Tax=Halopiger xanaduensis (strain DSM 18323 / JCM 14033 / SH-6) TaxID=797210 RepID=F8D536_HALXS|nr:lipoate--protein ligase family protein [Halopiger xanaduensis]AEH36388.1 biotin/lipoate A/B protein ligase [Halopiger xanaduensis SH-6]
MRVFRGRAATIEADRAASERLLEVAAAGEPAVRVWCPHRQVAFGRRDARLEGYDRASEAARAAGFPPVERDVGGRAVAYDGDATLAFARAEPVADFRRGTTARYERLTDDVKRALADLGVATERGEPDDSFCPGTHSLSVEGPAGERRKIVGIAQRVRQDAAVGAGIVLVDAREELADVLEAVYDALSVPLDPETVGTIASAGGPADSDRVRTALEAALVGDAEPTIEPISALEDGGGDEDGSER